MKPSKAIKAGRPLVSEDSTTFLRIDKYDASRLYCCADGMAYVGEYGMPSEEFIKTLDCTAEVLFNALIARNPEWGKTMRSPANPGREESLAEIISNLHCGWEWSVDDIIAWLESEGK